MANKISTVRTYPLNGAVDFTITFEYLARKFVKVTLIGKDRKELVLNQDYRFTTKTQITTSRAWTASDGYQMIEIRRFTSASGRLVDFADGSILRAYDLNISQIQTLHVTEEARDQTADLTKEYADSALTSANRAKASENEAARLAEKIRNMGVGGYVTVRPPVGSFTLGYTIKEWNEVLWNDADLSYYRWDGAVPKVVAVGSTPETAGGVGAGKWVNVADASLRSLFAGKDGEGLKDLYGGGGWTGDDVAGVNIYNNTDITYQNALRSRYSIPTTDNPSPTLWLEKKSLVTRDDGIRRWDNGNIYASLEKQGGTAYGAAGTFSARHNGGAGQLIGLHARGEARHKDAEVWGGWSYAAVSGPAGSGGENTGAKSAIIHEFNMNNGCSTDAGWMVSAENPGNTRGLVCVTQDGSNRITHMINIGRGGGAPNGFIWTGMLFRGDSIVAPTEAATVVGNGEYMRLEGSILSNAANGIRFRSGTFRVGISLTESRFSNNCAILLGDNQRITVGAGPANTTYLSFNRTENWANFTNLRIRLNSKQVISDRRTGWEVPTGTVSRAAFNSGTITHEDLAKVVAALIQDLHASTGHGLIGLT